MRRALYKYNEETCQYERVRLKPFDVIFYASGLLVASLLLLAGMLIVHDYLFDSEKELALRKENSAYKKNYAVLTSQLSEIESTLDALETEDKKLHTKFFLSPPEQQTPSDNTTRKQLLLADASAFRSAVEKLATASERLMHKSEQWNEVFANTDVFEKDKLYEAAGIPNIQPITPWETDKLLSGFGMRINPFHKGLYEHAGIDIAAPRGSEVVATAPGRVTKIKRSDVQAGYGNFIEIDHGNGYVTRYAHLEEIKVKLYQKVDKGAVIAISGNSGGSIAPHLHYEIIRDGKNVDPVNYMVHGLSSSDFQKLKTLSEKHNQSLD